MVTGIGVCSVLLLSSAMPSFAQEERVEPGVYKEREVLLELRQYKPEAEQREIRVPEEQKILTFTQPLEETYTELQDTLFASSAEADHQENVAASAGLFTEEKVLARHVVPVEENGNVLPWILAAVATVLVSILLIYIIPKTAQWNE
ncbi:type VII secretion EssA family protein [Shouchella lehensis]|uniref:type VII secretion EssA family protein n=1 Tax=Shouchella lehensis TaxID=300825 RepID=UPI001419D0DF|nr:type VII secretion EssA family protein [Shouchella lehensis]